MKTKVCTRCGKRKKLDCYSANGTRPNCKPCGVIQARVCRDKQRAAWRAGELTRPAYKVCPSCWKKKASRHFGIAISNAKGLSPYCKPCVRQIHRKYRRANIADQLIRTARTRAKASGLKFNLRRGDIEIPKYCPALGIPLKVGPGVLHHNSPTLDRVECRKGYVRGNVMVVSYLANAIKRDAKPEQIMKVAVFYKNLKRKKK